MKKICFTVMGVFAILIILTSTSQSYADSPTYVEEVKFIQYIDENTALEEVRNGNLDIYYFRIPSDRIESAESKEDLKVFESTGGSYSILVNPAEADKFNPFSIDEIRFALNYLVDRKLIVNELMGGHGVPMISNYGPFDPEYLTILDTIQEYNFRYNPSFAEKVISTELTKAGAKKVDNTWMINQKPIEITIFIRSDDPVRKSIGEILSAELARVGFKINKEFGDLNKAFVIVYGSDPAELKWNLYTEGWGGRSAFVRYDSVGLGQMYAPWFSNMPGFNDPTYWNYKNSRLDDITQKIHSGNFTSQYQRSLLIQNATKDGIDEAVRIFLASKIDQYVTNESVSGVVNDFGAGVPSRFTLINAKTDSDTLKVGVKQIYQGSWNPVGGLSDTYSKYVWDTLFDPALFKHPYNGKTIPIRADWKVESEGPEHKMKIPQDAVIWDPESQQWKNVDQDERSTSKVTFDFIFGDWHNGETMDMNDIIYSAYFTMEWGSAPIENDKTFDSEFTPRATQVVNTIKGIRIVDKDTIEVYVDYWHFDEGEIADWAVMWSSVPWELFAAMEEAVIDGKASFSRSGAVSKNVNWLSLILPNDSKTISEYLTDFKKSGFIPKQIYDINKVNRDYFLSRYDSSIEWIKKHNHSVISNGPFYLESYSPESRTITIKSFVNAEYPFEKGKWTKFENPNMPKITDVEFSNAIIKGESENIKIKTQHATKIHYFISNPDGTIVKAGEEKATNDATDITLSQETTKKLDKGSGDLKMFVVSESVLRPDFFSTGFLVLDNSDSIKELPKAEISYQDMEVSEQILSTSTGILISVAVVSTLIVFLKRRKKTIQ